MKQKLFHNMSTVTEDSEISPTSDNRITTSQCIQLIGNGRYQKLVYLLVGTMVFANTALNISSALILHALECEFDLDTALEVALVPGTYILSTAIGAFVGGRIADTFGRRKLILTALYTIAIGQIFAITAKQYCIYIITRCIVGFCVGMINLVGVAYTQEFSVITYRVFGVVQGQTIGVFGFLYASATCVFVMGLPEGWRWMMTLLLVPVLIVLVGFHFADESPRFYVTQGESEKALRVLQKMARCNGVDPSKTLMPTKVEPQRNSYMEVYQEPYTKISIILTIMNFCGSWCTGSILYFAADAMTYSFCDLNEMFTAEYTDEFGCTLYTRLYYIFLLVMKLCFFPGLWLGGCSVEYMGRKVSAIGITWAMVGLYCILLLLCVDYIIGVLILVVMAVIKAAERVLLYTFGPEIYPSYIRATASGVFFTFHQLGAAGGAFFTEYMDPTNMKYSVLSYTIASLLAAVAALFIDREMKGVALVDTRAEETCNGSVVSPVMPTVSQGGGTGLEKPPSYGSIPPPQ